MFKSMGRSREQGSFTSNQGVEYVETDTTSSPRKWFGGFSLKRKGGVASVSDGTGQRFHNTNDPDFYRREYYKQELDIQDLQQQVMARDADFEDLQQQWNLMNFKFCLLIDMWAMRVLDSEELAKQNELPVRSGTTLTSRLAKQ